jgi:predicted DCC family thiol-disulfide oxidoreductase YuxK
MTNRSRPLLLFDGACAVCDRIGQWVEKDAHKGTGLPRLDARAIGNDPVELRTLNPNLDIWDAYAIIHLLMPDGSMKTGGEAVAEVLRRLPATQWFAWCFAISLFGFKPFQQLLSLGYIILDDVRPLFGCASCGKQRAWVKQIASLIAWVKSGFGSGAIRGTANHFSHLPTPVVKRTSEKVRPLPRG